MLLDEYPEPGEPRSAPLPSDRFKPMPASFPTGADEALARVNGSALLTKLGTRLSVLAKWPDRHNGRERIRWQVFSEHEFFHLLNQHTVEETDGSNTKRVPLGKLWKRSLSRPHYPLGARFAPGETLPKGWFNTWTGFAVEPVSGDVQPMLEHVTRLCGGRDREVDELLDRAAYWVQHPGELGQVAVVLRGPKGTGKGAFAHVLLEIFGAHALHVHQRDQLTGKFNGHLENVAFLVADEAFFVGDKSAVNALKGQITDPTQMIERKGKDAYSAENRKSVLILTNEEHVVDATADERRFFVVDVPGDHAQDPDVFNPLWRWIHDGGAGRFLYYLLRRDLSDFSPFHTVRTAALTQQIRAGLDPVEQTVLAWMRDAVFPQTTAVGNVNDGRALELREWRDDDQAPRVAVAAVREYLIEQVGRRVYGGYDFEKRVGEIILGVLGGSRPRPRDGNNNRYYAYAMPPIGEARKAWATHHNGTVEEWFGTPQEAAA